MEAALLWWTGGKVKAWLILHSVISMYGKCIVAMDGKSDFEGVRGQMRAYWHEAWKAKKMILSIPFYYY